MICKIRGWRLHSLSGGTRRWRRPKIERRAEGFVLSVKVAGRLVALFSPRSDFFRPGRLEEVYGESTPSYYTEQNDA